MKYRPLGHSGINVSVICLGSMTWGTQNSEQDAHQQLDYALANGVNFIDTAEIYPVPIKDTHQNLQGRTEQYIGTWLAKNQAKRSEIVLASKIVGLCGFGKWLRPDLSKGQFNIINKANILAALDASLARLQTDYLDLYQIHWPARDTNFFGKRGMMNTPTDNEYDAFAEIVETMNQLIKQGKIRSYGTSNETPFGMMEYIRMCDKTGLIPPTSIQNPYSLLNRTFEVGLSEIAMRCQIPLLSYSPLAFGALSGKYLDGQMPADARLALYNKNKDFGERYVVPQAQKATKAYVTLAQKYQLDPAQMALAFVNGRDFLASTIIGASTLAQLESNIASIDIDLNDEMMKEIDAIYQQQPDPSP